MLIANAVSLQSALTVGVRTAAAAVPVSGSVRCAADAAVHLHPSGTARCRGGFTAARPRTAAGSAGEQSRC